MGLAPGERATQPLANFRVDHDIGVGLAIRLAQENYGQLKVASVATSKALPKVYVKVYVRLADGSVKFHKDGYTDLRGRFEYASVNTPERQAIERFSILVLSDDRGALIREAAPPLK